jgi:hypothetical protein
MHITREKKRCSSFTFLWRRCQQQQIERDYKSHTDTCIHIDIILIASTQFYSYAAGEQRVPYNLEILSSLTSHLS